MPPKQTRLSLSPTKLARSSSVGSSNTHDSSSFPQPAAATTKGKGGNTDNKRSTNRAADNRRSSASSNTNTTNKASSLSGAPPFSRPAKGKGGGGKGRSASHGSGFIDLGIADSGSAAHSEVGAGGEEGLDAVATISPREAALTKMVKAASEMHARRRAAMEEEAAKQLLQSKMQDDEERSRAIAKAREQAERLHQRLRLAATGVESGGSVAAAAESHAALTAGITNGGKGSEWSEAFSRKRAMNRMTEAVAAAAAAATASLVGSLATSPAATRPNSRAGSASPTRSTRMLIASRDGSLHDGTVSPFSQALNASGTSSPQHPQGLTTLTSSLYGVGGSGYDNSHFIEAMRISSLHRKREKAKRGGGGDGEEGRPRALARRRSSTSVDKGNRILGEGGALAVTSGSEGEDGDDELVIRNDDDGEDDETHASVTHSKKRNTDSPVGNHESTATMGPSDANELSCLTNPPHSSNDVSAPSIQGEPSANNSHSHRSPPPTARPVEVKAVEAPAKAADAASVTAAVAPLPTALKRTPSASPMKTKERGGGSASSRRSTNTASAASNRPTTPSKKLVTVAGTTKKAGSSTNSKSSNSETLPHEAESILVGSRPTSAAAPTISRSVTIREGDVTTRPDGSVTPEKGQGQANNFHPSSPLFSTTNGEQHRMLSNTSFGGEEAEASTTMPADDAQTNAFCQLGALPQHMLWAAAGGSHADQNASSSATSPLLNNGGVKRKSDIKSNVPPHVPVKVKTVGCPAHEFAPFIAYCHTCNVPICSMCLATDHPSTGLPEEEELLRQQLLEEGADNIDAKALARKKSFARKKNNHAMSSTPEKNAVAFRHHTESLADFTNGIAANIHAVKENNTRIHQQLDALEARHPALLSKLQGYINEEIDGLLDTLEDKRRGLHSEVHAMKGSLLQLLTAELDVCEKGLGQLEEGRHVLELIAEGSGTSHTHMGELILGTLSYDAFLLEADPPLSVPPRVTEQLLLQLPIRSLQDVCDLVTWTEASMGSAPQIFPM